MGPARLPTNVHKLRETHVRPSLLTAPGDDTAGGGRQVGQRRRSWPRRAIPNFRKIFCKCVFTVLALMPSWVAISTFVIPCTAHMTTSCSRPLRTSQLPDRAPCGDIVANAMMKVETRTCHIP